MQTLRDSAGSSAGARSLAAIAAAGAMIMSLAGCSAPAAAPRLQAQVDDVAKPSTCEGAYLTAVSGSSGATAAAATGSAATDSTSMGSAATGSAVEALPAMMRYFAARTSADAWTTVAVSCTGRFTEGTMRSAQSSYIAQSIASRLGANAPSPGSVNYGDVVGFDVDPSVLTALSLAEDRAGFGIEVLAARGVPGATLSMSDDHKTAAQRLFTLSGADKDPRQKVYTVNRLITDAGVIDDPATGVAANTVSVVEMNCAREYLDAIGEIVDGDATSGSDTAAADGGTASGKDATSTRASGKTLEWLSKAASARAWRAFDLGYPAFDAVLFR